MLQLCSTTSHLFILIVFLVAVGYGKTSGHAMRYGVALTTIPPRFGVLQYQLHSWLKQSIVAQSIRVFVPQSYRRFRSRRGKKTDESYKYQLISQLHAYPNISDALHSNLIQVLEIDHDWGPLTKFVGVVQTSSVSKADTVPIIDFWIFCDDDIEYSPYLAKHYAMYISALNDDNASLHLPYKRPDYRSFGFTMFTSEQRLQFHLNSFNGRQEMRNVPHIQGVDSYIIPSAVLSGHFAESMHVMLTVSESPGMHSQMNTVSPLSNASNVLRIISRIHSEWCPDSFYQDDYIVSTLLNLSGVYMYSARLASPYCGIDYVPEALTGESSDRIDCVNGVSLTRSIEGVSKNHYQMHMKEEVFAREAITQQCLIAHANEIYDMLHDNV